MKLFFLALILVSEYGWKQLLDRSFNYWGYRFIVQASIISFFFLFFRPSPLLFLVALGGAWLGTIELVEKHIKNQGFRCAWRLLCFGLLFGYGLFWQPIGNGIYFSLAKLIKPEIIAVFFTFRSACKLPNSYFFRKNRPPDSRRFTNGFPNPPCRKKYRNARALAACTITFMRVFRRVGICASNKIFSSFPAV